jgi:hypothetical protein
LFILIELQITIVIISYFKANLSFQINGYFGLSPILFAIIDADCCSTLPVAKLLSRLAIFLDFPFISHYHQSSLEHSLA